MAEDTSYSCTLDVAKRLIELKSAKVAGKKKLLLFTTNRGGQNDFSAN